MYLYDHLTTSHMTAYLYNRAILLGTPLFPPFVCFPLFSSCGICDYHCSWPYCFVTSIVCDAIVLPFCMLSQVAALLYISWTYILELGLKPDLVCNLLHSKVLVAWKAIFFYSFLEVVFNLLKTLPIPLYLHPDLGLTNTVKTKAAKFQ